MSASDDDRQRIEDEIKKARAQSRSATRKDTNVGKPKFKEEIAAAFVIRTLTDNIEERWPKMMEDFRRDGLDMVDTEVLNSLRGVQEFGWACLALEMQALSNLVPSEQGRRCREHMLAILRIVRSQLPSDPLEAVGAYERVFVQALAIPENPLLPVAAEYLTRVGLPESPVEASVVSPLAASVVAGLLVSFVGVWKAVLDTRILVP